MKTQAELGLYGTPAYRCKTRQNGYSLVRDQEVEGSNPSAPTKCLFRVNKINVLRSANRRFFSLPQGFSSLDLLVSDQGAGRDLSNLPYKLASRSPGWQRPCLFLAVFAHRPISYRPETGAELALVYYSGAAGSRFMANEMPRVLDQFRLVLIAVDRWIKHAGSEIPSTPYSDSVPVPAPWCFRI